MGRERSRALRYYFIVNILHERMVKAVFLRRSTCNLPPHILEKSQEVKSPFISMPCELFFAFWQFPGLTGHPRCLLTKSYACISTLSLNCQLGLLTRSINLMISTNHFCAYEGNQGEEREATLTWVLEVFVLTVLWLNRSLGESQMSLVCSGIIFPPL